MDTTFISVSTMDYGAAGSNGCRRSRLALSQNSELAYGFGPAGGYRGQHQSPPLAGTGSRITGTVIGLGSLAAVCARPQPRRRGLETRRRRRSLSRSTVAVLRAHGDGSSCGSHGLGRSHLEGTTQADAHEHRSFTGRVAEFADAWRRGVARRSAIHQDSIWSSHGAHRFMFCPGPGTGAFVISYVSM